MVWCSNGNCDKGLVEIAGIHGIIKRQTMSSPQTGAQGLVL